MIAPSNKSFPGDRRQADKFVRAVDQGAEVFAAPETARLMAEFLPVKPCDWMEEGSLYAIDIGRYDLSRAMGMPKELFDESDSGNYSSWRSVYH